MIIDRVAFDLPAYDGLLAGHYVRGQGYSRRRPGGTDDWLLVMTLAGEGRFGTVAGDLVARAPALYLVAPGTTHDYGTAKSSETWEILWVHFQPPTGWLDLLAWPLVAPGIYTLEPDDPGMIECALREVCRLSVSSHRRSRRLAMNALERLLLLSDAQLPEPVGAMDDRIRATIEFIHGHLSATLACEELAARASLSTSRFAHLFREQTGMPPLKYVQIQRLERARTLLERTTLGIAEIAAEVGMDPFYFSMRFKSRNGISPAGFRNSRLKSDALAPRGRLPAS